MVENKTEITWETGTGLRSGRAGQRDMVEVVGPGRIRDLR